MKRKYLIKIGIVLSVLICALCLCSCGDEPEERPHEKKTAAPTDVVSDNTPELTEEPTEISTEIPKETAQPSENPETDFFKISGGADNAGIYAIVVSLKSGAPDKGKFELIYHGEKGSPQENSIVNTFLIEYWKDDSGTFEIRTFFDGEAYQNLHERDEVKVTNEFGAALRAGDVTVFFTPDGGDKVEIFKAMADYFR